MRRNKSGVTNRLLVPTDTRHVCERRIGVERPFYYIIIITLQGMRANRII